MGEAGRPSDGTLARVSRGLSAAGSEVFIDLSEPTGAPMHIRLAGGLREAIRSGRLTPGTKLLPTRVLAIEMGCSRWVVTEAYEQLQQEGWLESRVGSGTRVRAHPISLARRTVALAPLQRAHRFDLRPGLPDLRTFPHKLWLSALHAASASMSRQDLSFPDRSGHPRLRELIAEYLCRARGANTTADNIVVCTSVIDGLTRIANALSHRGERSVAVEEPTWSRIPDVISTAGLEVVRVPVDDDGIRVAALRMCRATRSVVVSPTHQYPSGVRLSWHRRADLLEWSRQTGGLVIEDDYDSEFRYDRRIAPSLQGLAPERVALLGSLSKTLSPALGLGWMIAPAPIHSLVMASDVRVLSPPVLDQLALAQLLETGQYDRHLREARTRYRIRRDNLIAAIESQMPGARISGQSTGLHLVMTLDAPVSYEGIARLAASRGLLVHTLASFSSNGNRPDGLVIAYGDLPDEHVPAAVELLAGCVAQSTSCAERRTS